MGVSAMLITRPTTSRHQEGPVTQTVSGPIVRTSIREIREYAFRSLIAAGASAGEALVAADQVLHAELHCRDGLVGLVADLLGAPWPRTGLSCARSIEPHGVQFTVQAAERAGALRLGSLLTDLVAGEPGPAVAVTDGDIEVSGLLDGLLLSAARSAGMSALAVRLSGSGPLAVRVATPVGDVGEGRVDPSQVIGVTAGAGTAFATGVLVEPNHLSGLVWSTTEDRRERRREAARHGVKVDAHQWRIIEDHARSFLVPEPVEQT